MTRSALTRNLLWVDCAAGGLVGVVTLTLVGWLSSFYGLPRGLVTLMGWANLIYAGYSLSLALRSRRPMALVWLLVVANSSWAVLCLRWAVVHGGSASPFGIAHLLLEALFVGGLASQEWRCRKQLLDRWGVSDGPG